MWKKRSVGLAFVLFSFVACVQCQILYNITTIAGGGSVIGDGLQATSAKLNSPFGVTLGSNGEVYIADTNNFRIRKILVNGTITTIAGIGSPGSTGDGGLATLAKFSSPTCVVIGSGGEMFITDRGNRKIRKLSTNGTISTHAGNGTAGSGGDGGLAINAQLGLPNSVAISPSGDLYIADYFSHKIRKISTNGTISTYAGNGTAGFSGDGGMAINAQLNLPYGIAISPSGDIYVAEFNGHVIRKISTSGYISTIAGNGTAGYSGDGGLATNSQLNSPGGVAISSVGEIFIVEYDHRVRKISIDGIISTIAGNGTQGYSGDGGLATRAQLSRPTSAALSESGEIYISDFGNNVIRLLKPYCANGLSVSSNCVKEQKFSIVGLPSYVMVNSDVVNFELILSKLEIDQSIIDSFLQSGTNNTLTFSIQSSSFSPVSQNLKISMKNSQSGFLSILPTLTISNKVSINYTSQSSGFSATVTMVIVNSVGSTIQSKFSLPFSLPPQPSVSNLMNTSSNECVAVKDVLSITISPWMSDVIMHPLKYAISITTSKLNSVRITEFSEGLNRTIVLPFLNENITLGIIVLDTMGNYYFRTSQVSIMVKVFNGTKDEYLQIGSSGTSFNLVNSLVYDLSFSGPTTYYSSLISGIDVKGSDASSALASVSQIVSKTSLDETVANSTLSKLSELVSVSYDRYNTSKSNFGYVNSKLSDDNVNSILGHASEFIGSDLLTSSSRELVQQLANLIIFGQFVNSIDVFNASISTNSFSSSNINMTISAFVISSPQTTQNVNQKVDQDLVGVTFNASYIISQYSAYSSECAISLLTYSNVFSNNSYVTNNDTISAESLSITTDFKFFKNQQVLNLVNLEIPIVINFKLENSLVSKLENSTIYNFTCAYLEEDTGLWTTKGCYMSGYNGRTVQCSCNHTTLFTTFLEQKTIPLSDKTKQQVASLYYGQISLGIFYFIISTIVLMLIVVFRKKQPLSSRLSTPYLGMIALMVESVLIYIVQRSVLVDQLFRDSTNWSSGDLASNWIANIVMIFVNTLNLTAILAYLIQVCRYQIMKYLYHILHQLRLNQFKDSRGQTLKYLRRFTSNMFVNGILIVFAIVNIIYWTFWVILRRCEVIPLTTYTYIISISYIVLIFSMSALITCIAIVDFIISMKSQLSNKKESKEESNKTKIDLQDVKDKINSMGIHKWLISMDSPLYFRGEMLLYIVFFILLIVNQSLGMSTLPYRYENEQSYRNVLVNDSIAFIFEVLYIVVYILVFGGYTLLIIISNNIKLKLRKVPNLLQQDSSDDDNREILQVLNNSYGRSLFEDFCEKEFSTENLYLYLELHENQHLLTTNNNSDRNDLNDLISRIFNNHIKFGAAMEVNIPSSCSKQFTKLYNNMSNISETEMVDMKNNSSFAVREQVEECFKDLKDNILLNISDTFSRFVLTSEYEFFSQSFDTQNNLCKSLNMQ